ncbi:MAG: hypothetical protein NXI32_08280 [bacterium]|nr:hypothetical protein [bacterium]
MLKQIFVGMLLTFLGSFSLNAQETAEVTTMELADGQIVLQPPKEWESQEPKFRGIIQYEFSAPLGAKEEEPTARITVSRSGGSIDANIERWYGQFTQPDGKATKDVAKSEKFEIAGRTVYLLDMTGTFKESMGGGPFAPGKTVMREDYRMLGAIVDTKDSGLYFIMMTGPKDVCEELAEGFKKMLKEMKVIE